MTVEVRSEAKCLGLKSDGKPCQSRILTANGYCYAHDPSVVDERALARQRGGRASSKLHRARRLAPPALLEVYETLEAGLREVHTGDLTPASGAAMASIARAMVSVLQAGELEQRLRAIEETLG
jgi:hypothetical protein